MQRPSPLLVTWNSAISSLSGVAPPKVAQIHSSLGSSRAGTLPQLSCLLELPLTVPQNTVVIAKTLIRACLRSRQETRVRKSCPLGSSRRGRACSPDPHRRQPTFGPHFLPHPRPHDRWEAHKGVLLATPLRVKESD